MTDYKATPEQWNQVQQCADIIGSADCSVILELRSMAEALEAAAQKHIVETSANILALVSRVEALEAAKHPTSKVYEINEPLQLTPEQAQQITDLLTPNSSAGLTGSNYPVKPDRLLVRRVALAISGIEYGLERDEEASTGHRKPAPRSAKWRRGCASNRMAILLRRLCLNGRQNND